MPALRADLRAKVDEVHAAGIASGGQMKGSRLGEGMTVFSLRLSRRILAETAPQREPHTSALILICA